MNGQIREKLKELGLELPEVAKPLASYVPARRSGRLVYISGQLPLENGKLTLTGAMTPESDLAAAQSAMARCFLNGLAAATLVTELDEVEQVIRLGAYVTSTANFTDQHKVANGASDLAQQIFGSRGVHARAAVGVPSLPMGATVELEIIFELSAAASS